MSWPTRYDLAIRKRLREAKVRGPGSLVLIRVGDFYEAFYTDAEVASRVLGLPVTYSMGIPMVGFPCSCLDDQVQCLQQAGHRVVVCEDDR